MSPIGRLPVAWGGVDEAEAVSDVCGELTEQDRVEKALFGSEQSPEVWVGEGLPVPVTAASVSGDDVEMYLRVDVHQERVVVVVGPEEPVKGGLDLTNAELELGPLRCAEVHDGFDWTLTGQDYLAKQVLISIDGNVPVLRVTDE
jgi:hypothetical protein